MRVLVLILALLPGLAMADERHVRLYAAPALMDSGLIQHIKPRFSLKTQVRVEIAADPTAADLVLGPEGRALFAGLGETWHMDMRTEARGAQRFADWLVSEVGQRTILGFAPEGAALFSEPEVQEVAVVQREMTGDAVMGKVVSYAKCSRCHVTERGRGTMGIGSTPSFFVMRTFEDWEQRFSIFYTLKPHPAFTQVKDVTAPFPIDRPSPIAPIGMTLEDVESILAYVATIEPADLGAPLEHQ